MLQSRAGCCFWMFPALCSWMVLKCPLGPGAARAWQQLCAAFPCLRTGRQRGAVLLLLFFLLLLLRCPIPVLRSLGLCSALGRDEGRMVFDLCSSFWKKISAPALSCPAERNSSSIHPSMDPIPRSHEEQCSRVSSVPARGDKFLGQVCDSSAPLQAQDLCLNLSECCSPHSLPEHPVKDSRAWGRTRISLLREDAPDPFPPPAQPAGEK